MKTRLLLAALTLCAASPYESEPSMAETAWKDGHWLEARNAWTRALAWDRLSPTLSAERRLDMESRRGEAMRRWQASLPAPEPERPAPPAEKRKRRRRPKSKVEVVPVDVAEIVARARAARRAGQLDSALRLFRLAAPLPGGEEAAREAAEVAAEIGGQAVR